MGMKAVDAVSGCWAKAAPDDYVFILKSSDSLAPGIVREWARRFQEAEQAHFAKLFAQLLSEPNRRSLILEQAQAMLKYAEALKVADDMEQQGLERYYTDK